MKRILNVFKVEYIASIVIFITIIYKNFLNSLWFIGVITLLFNILNIPTNKIKDGMYILLNRWRMNINAVLSILLIIYGVIYKDNLFLLAGCITFIVCIYNISKMNKRY